MSALALIKVAPKPPAGERRKHPAIPLFYRGEGTRCPGCSRSQWLVGLSTSECAFCATALPIAGAKDRQ